MLIVDTGPILAAADTSDPDHATCLDLLEGDAGPLVTTAMVVAEAAYLINRQLGPQAEVALYDSIVEGTLNVEPLGTNDWERIRELVDAYADFPLGGTDAGLVAIAERLVESRIATLDHRHFGAIRPAHIEAFTLLP